MTLLLACLALAAIGLPDGATGVAWPAIRMSFGLPQAGIGLLLGAMSFGVFCAGTVAGRLMQRLAFPRLLLASGLAMAAGIAIEAIAPHAVLLALGAILAGLGSGMLDCAVNAAGALRFSARGVNWMHGCYGLGATVSPLLLTALLAGAGLSWRIGYACLAAILLLIALVLHRGSRRAAIPPIPARDPQTRGARGAIRHRLVPILIATFFVYTGVEVVLGQWCYSILTEARGVAPAAAGTIAAAYWISLAGGRFAFGSMIGRVGPDRVIRLAGLGVIGGSLAFVAAPAAFGVIGLMLAGAALGPIFPTMMSRNAHRLGADVAVHAVGFSISAAVLGGAALPTLAGALAQFAGLNAIGWFATAAAILLMLLHEVVLAMTRPRPP